MKRTLPLIALALLLVALAPAARGGELDAQEQAVKDAATKVELLLVQRDETENAEKRAELEARIADARALWEARKAELARVRTVHESIRQRYAIVGRQVQALMVRLTAIRQEAEARSKALAEQGDAKAGEVYAPYLQRVTESLGVIHAAAEAIERIAAALENGDLAVAYDTLAKAEERAAHARTLIDVARSEKERLTAALDARRAVEEGNRARAAKLREDAARLAADRAAVAEAKDRIEAVDGKAVRVRGASSDVARLRRRVEQMAQNLERMREQGVDEDFPPLADAERRLDAMKKQLAAIASDRPFHTTVRLGGARRAILESAIAAKEAKLAELRTGHPDAHPEVERLQREIHALKGQLGKVVAAGADTPSALQVEVDEDGRYVIVGDAAGRVKLRGRILGAEGEPVEGKIVVETGPTEKEGDTGDRPFQAGPAGGGKLRVVTHDGKVVFMGPEGHVLRKLAEAQRPVTVTKSSTVRMPAVVWTPQQAKLAKQIDHLRKAAKLLRDAGQTAEAERLEKKAKALEKQRTRYTVVGAGNAEVLKAVGELRSEVRALRQEVRELKALILKGR